jgi:hypothetical protein
MRHAALTSSRPSLKGQAFTSNAKPPLGMKTTSSRLSLHVTTDLQAIALDSYRVETLIGLQIANTGRHRPLSKGTLKSGDQQKGKTQ